MSRNNNLNRNITSNILAIFAWAVDKFCDVIKAERSFIDVLASCQCLAKVLVFLFPVLRVRKVIKLWPFFNVIFCIPHSSSNLSFYSKHLIKSQLSFLQFFKTFKNTIKLTWSNQSAISLKKGFCSDLKLV